MKKILSIVIVGIILGANALVASNVLTKNTAYAAPDCTKDSFSIEEMDNLQDEFKNFEDYEICAKQLNTKKQAECNGDQACIDEYNKTIEALQNAAAMSAAESDPDKYIVDDSFELSDIRTNQCIGPDDKTKITAVIEEPLDTDLAGQPENSSGDTGEIRNCVRTTLCVERAEKRGLECVAYMNKLEEGAEYCKQASDRLAADSNSASYTLTVDGKVRKALVTCKPIQIILGTSGFDILYTYIGFIYRWGAGAAGIIAVLIIVVSGIQISASGGDQQAVTSAKTRILTSIGGLALLFLSAILLYTINPTFFVK